MSAITKFRELVAPKKSSADRRKRKEALLSDHIDILVQIEAAEQARNAELADSDKETRQRHRETIKTLLEDLKDIEDSIAAVDIEIAEAETAERVVAPNAEADQLDKANAEVTRTYRFEKEWREKWSLLLTRLPR
jgi:hypothetical protein